MGEAARSALELQLAKYCLLGREALKTAKLGFALCNQI